MSDERKRLRKVEGLNAFNAFELFTLGYDDYLAARILLRGGMFVQGASMAATAVEKYLKGLTVMRGGKRFKGHITASLVKSVNNYFPKMFDKINRDFVLFLSRAYDMRYYDS